MLRQSVQYKISYFACNIHMLQRVWNRISLKVAVRPADTYKCYYIDVLVFVIIVIK
jgi:hypothetical protein